MNTAIRIAIFLMAAVILVIRPSSVLAEDALPPAPYYVWEDGKLSIKVKDADVNDVVAGISKATGIEIKIYDDVQGKITNSGEKEPVEKVIDQALRSVGYKNYVMAQEGGEARKIWILPKGKEISDPGAKDRMKVKGKLRNGKEIEYYPGEIVIGIHLFKDYETGLPILIRALEERYGLQLVNKAKVISQDALKFRILGGQDVLEIMQQIREDYSNDFRITYITPNGIGPHSLEMPDDDFHVWREPKETGTSARLKANPHLRFGYVDGRIGHEEEYFEGEFSLIVEHEDRSQITYEDVLTMAMDENGLVVGYGINSAPSVTERDENYLIYFPELDSDKLFSEKLSHLREKVHALRTNRGTEIGPRLRCEVNLIPNDYI